VHIKDNSPLAATAIPESRTVAFRCPGDAWLREIISRCQAPIFSTSVNRSGQPVLDTTNAITQEFANEVDLIIDDGDKKGALPSTLVTIENRAVKVLRQGSVKI
jgi:L-threonylcarbamoyladenylate synthase